MRWHRGEGWWWVVMGGGGWCGVVRGDAGGAGGAEWCGWYGSGRYGVVKGDEAVLCGLERGQEG